MDRNRAGRAADAPASVPTLSYGTVDPVYAARLAGTPPEEDGPVWMVNLMSYRERAHYGDGDGDGDGDDQGRSGREADDAYAPFDVLADIGASVVFVADVAEQLLGVSPRWDRVAVVRYPTRRSFIDMQTRSDYRDRHRHKSAGMAATIVMGSLPVLRPDLPGATGWDEVPHPPTDDDGPVVVTHVIRWSAEQREDMAGYETAAAAAAAPQGLRLGGWFDVEGTIVGDGRTWNQVRLNVFPSRRAFQAVLEDPRRLEAQRSHRAPAIEDTYTMVLRPQSQLSRLEEALAADGA